MGCEGEGSACLWLAKRQSAVYLGVSPVESVSGCRLLHVYLRSPDWDLDPKASEYEVVGAAPVGVKASVLCGSVSAATRCMWAVVCVLVVAVWLCRPGLDRSYAVSDRRVGIMSGILYVAWFYSTTGWLAELISFLHAQQICVQSCGGESRHGSWMGCALHCDAEGLFVFSLWLLPWLGDLDSHDSYVGRGRVFSLFPIGNVTKNRFRCPWHAVAQHPAAMFFEGAVCACDACKRYL